MKLSAACRRLQMKYENITYQHALWCIGKNTDFNSESSLSLLSHKVAGVGNGLIRIQDLLPLIYSSTLLGMPMEYNPIREPYKYPYMTHTRQASFTHTNSGYVLFNQKTIAKVLAFYPCFVWGKVYSPILSSSMNNCNRVGVWYVDKETPGRKKTLSLLALT